MVTINKIFKIRKSSSKEVALENKCTLIVAQNHAEIIVLDRRPYDFKSKEVSNTKYINQRKEKMIDSSITDDYTKTLDSRRKTFKRLDAIIADNFNGGQSQLFLTLGYSYTMSDTTKLNRDRTLFFRKLKRRYKNCEYVYVTEYKANKSLHIHIFIKDANNKRLFLDRDLIIKLWGQTDVFIQRINTKADVVKLTNYLNPFKNRKKFQRLHYYEQNFRIYNCSNGIIKPETISNITVEQAIDYLIQNSYKHSYSTSYDIVQYLSDDKLITLNTVNRIIYNKSKEITKNEYE